MEEGIIDVEEARVTPPDKKDPERRFDAPPPPLPALLLSVTVTEAALVGVTSEECCPSQFGEGVDEGMEKSGELGPPAV